MSITSEMKRVEHKRLGWGRGSGTKCGEMNGYLIRYAKVLDGIPSNITLPEKCG
jgi:hypothetical protein